MSGLEIVSIARRLYRCADCGNEVVLQTNHRVTCYPVCAGRCRQIVNPHTEGEVVLPRQTTHVFVRDVEEKEPRT